MRWFRARVVEKIAYLSNHSADSSQTLQDAKDHQALFAGGPNHAYYQSKVVDNRHF